MDRGDGEGLRKALRVALGVGSPPSADVVSEESLGFSQPNHLWSLVYAVTAEELQRRDGFELLPIGQVEDGRAEVARPGLVARVLVAGDAEGGSVAIPVEVPSRAAAPDQKCSGVAHPVAIADGRTTTVGHTSPR